MTDAVYVVDGARGRKDALALLKLRENRSVQVCPHPRGCCKPYFILDATRSRRIPVIRRAKTLPLAISVTKG